MRFLSPGQIFRLLRDAFSEWKEDNALRLGAALSFYTVLAMPPLLILILAGAGVVFGREGAQERIVAQMEGLIGTHGRELTSEMLTGQGRPGSTLLASIAGAGLLILSATGVFGQLRGALNTIWDVEEKPGGGIKGLIKERILSFNILLAAGFILIVSLVVSAGIGALTDVWGNRLEGFKILLAVLDFLVSAGVLTALFALLFKFLPDTRVAWRDVWIGGAVTAVLFALGKLAIGFYLGKSSVTSGFGAAGPLVILLLWIYYSSQIFFFGAEFTQVFASAHGSRLPSKRTTRRGEAAGAAATAEERQIGPPSPAPKARPKPRAWGALAWRFLLLLGGTLLIDRVRRRSL